ncbi:MAG: hypothetical protein WD208_03675 [Dehalococcoidia bacterium]
MPYRFAMLLVLAMIAVTALACEGSATVVPLPSATSEPTASIGSPMTESTPTATAVSSTPTLAPTVTPTPTATPDPTEEFFLYMEAPGQDEAFVDSEVYEVTGRTTVDALVSVNDTIAQVDEDGRFRVTVSLEEGPNFVEVVASNTAGDQASEILLIIYEAPAA